MRKTLIALLLAASLPTLALAMPEGGPDAPCQMPMHGDQPTGALLKPAEEKGSGKNVTTPAQPNQAPGQTDPNHPENRDLSLNGALPFAPETAQA